MSSSNPGPATTTGTNTLGGGSPAVLGDTTSSLIGFCGATPVARGTFVAAQSINAVSVSGTVGFTSSTSLSSLVEKVNAIAALLATLGLTAAS